MVDYSEYYTSPYLKKKANEIENSVTISDEIAFFKDKVNPKLNKKYPYYRWARYREGFSGELVKELIIRSRLDNRKHFIFDPMCGSGSTQIAAAELGFDSLGLDVNQYAIDLSNSKFQKFTKTQINMIKRILRNLNSQCLQGTLDVNIKTQECQKYFSEQNYNQLQFVLEKIGCVKDYGVKHLMNVAWLTILENCSERKKDGNGLATRPSKVENVIDYYIKQVDIMVEDIVDHPLPDVLSETLNQSALNSHQIVNNYSKKAGKQLGAVIFSPPYANSFDYFESYKIELICGYYSPKELVEARKKAIRNYRKGYGHYLHSGNLIVEELANDIRAKIPEKEKINNKVDNRSRLVPNLLVGYFEDMTKVLEELSMSMPRTSKCYIVVDQSSYLGVIIPTDLLFIKIARDLGFTVNSLIKCRRAATSAQQLKAYPYLNSILRESIVILEK